MQFEGFWRYLQIQVAHFEEALLKYDAENFVS
jgi:hypothetical protein